MKTLKKEPIPFVTSSTNPVLKVCEIELIYKPTIKPSQRPQVGTSQEVHELLRENWDENKIELVEEFKVMLLNRANKVIGLVDISLGGFAGTIADPKVIFVAALKAGASSLILAHNHPSGNLKPSKADISLTHKIISAGCFLDISVFDHIIITAEGYLSFADESLM
ncbi:MAG TPA: JAB domain-containing protein [Sphingobacteriaceae bacterium]